MGDLILQRNLNNIRNNTDFYNAVFEEEDLNPLKSIEVLENNVLVQSIDATVYLKSMYSHANEFDKLMTTVESDVECLVLFGIGNPIIIEEVYKRFEILNHIIIIEPSSSLFRHHISEIDFDLYKRKYPNIAISFLVNKSVQYLSNYIMQVFALFKTGKMYFATNITYVSLFKEYYYGYYDNVALVVKTASLNMRTSALCLPNVWSVNTLMNLRFKHAFVENLSEKLEGVPILLVMAGPSLNKNIHFIESAKDKMLICAVGSALNILDHHNIKAHIRIAYDGFPEEALLFKDLNSYDVPLLYGGQLESTILRDYSNKIMHFLSDTNYLENYLFKLAKLNRINVRSGFSVANVSVDIAASVFKTKKIVFVGQDLCISEKRYAEGRVADEVISDEEKSRFMKLKDIHGNVVYTEEEYLGMRLLHENYIESRPDIEFYNATEGGLPIKGATNISLKDIVEVTPVFEKNISQTLNDILSKQESINSNYDCIMEAMKQLRDEISIVQELIQLSVINIKIVEKLIGDNAKINRMSIEFGLLEKKFNEIISMPIYEDFIKYVIKDFVYAINRKHYIKDKTEVSIKSFEKRTDSISKHIAMISEYVNRLAYFIDNEILVEGEI